MPTFHIHGEFPVVATVAGIRAEDLLSGIQTFYRVVDPGQLVDRILEEPGAYDALEQPKVVQCRQSGDFGNIVVDIVNSTGEKQSLWFHVQDGNICEGRKEDQSGVGGVAPATGLSPFVQGLLTPEEVVENGVVPRFCPYCGHKDHLVDAATVYVGEGECSNHGYAFEGIANGVRCTHCGQGFVGWRPEEQGETQLPAAQAAALAPTVVDTLRSVCEEAGSEEPKVSLRAPVTLVDLGFDDSSGLHRWRADLGEIEVVEGDSEHQRILARVGCWKQYADQDVPYLEGRDYQALVPLLLKAAKLDGVAQTEKGKRPGYVQTVTLPLTQLAA
jgi:hypothetical protein